MKQGWDDYNEAVKKGPLSFGIKAIMGLFTLIIIISTFSFGIDWIGETGDVIRQEFGPQAMLKKYEWFKDAAATLEKIQADVNVYQQRINSIRADYDGISRREWDRTDKEQMSVWQSEVAGVKANFNGIAAEYNAQMSKVNWSFANVGMLPEGATNPLPREFKTYLNN